jgi:leucyl/phenylalanyl-tRNA--protein transferase
MNSIDHHEPLRPELILAAYRMGFFPMAESRSGPIAWYSPDPRTVIPLESFRCPRSLRRTLRKTIYTVKVNTSFRDVIVACADRPETWISAEIVNAYCELHRLGHAHSVESWREGRLAGGLYGVAIGGAFFGESMFSRETDASKVALAALVERLREREFLLLDSQFMNEHIRQFGAVEIPQRVYIERLQEAVAIGTVFADRM